MRKFITYLLKSLVVLYQKLVSPMLPNRCRFYPSCSQYALDALEAKGPWKGSRLVVRRLLKCHPFHPGGVDYVLDQEVKK